MNRRTEASTRPVQGFRVLFKGREPLPGTVQVRAFGCGKRLAPRTWKGGHHSESIRGVTSLPGLLRRYAIQLIYRSDAVRIAGEGLSSGSERLRDSGPLWCPQFRVPGEVTFLRIPVKTATGSSLKTTTDSGGKAAGYSGRKPPPPSLTRINRSGLNLLSGQMPQSAISGRSLIRFQGYS